MNTQKKIHTYRKQQLGPLFGIGIVTVSGIGLLTALQSIDLQATTISFAPISNWNTQPAECEDSDGGYNPYTKGVLSTGDIEFKDFCYKDYLYEYSCGWKDGMEGDPRNGFGKLKKKCSSGCKDGACIQQDDCGIDGCKEGYTCSDGECKQHHDACSVMDCAYGCKDGVCIKLDVKKFDDHKKDGICTAKYSSCNCGYSCQIVYKDDPLMDCNRECSHENEKNNFYMPDCKFNGSTCMDVSKKKNEEFENIPPAGFEDEVRVKTGSELITPTKNWFLDVDLNSPEGKAANILAEKKIIGGFPDGTFRMNQMVNRAEAAKFIVIAKYKEIGEYQNSGKFWDVKDGEWYVPYVIKAAKYGIITGNPDGSFRPADSVNTVEFLSMISRAFDLPTGLDYPYTDVPTSSWFAEYAGIAQQYHLFPKRGTLLQPERLLTRGEVAIAIALLLEQIE